ncbi:MAG: fibronectin type III domain-containing protein [Lachnospiraceae bacterium]|nr:fibronectin type III domain-containing protein [Lachnospiraceae bacterium]
MKKDRMRTRKILCTAALCLLLLGGTETVRAASLELGNSSENILNGGVLASDASGDVVYYANTEKSNALYSLEDDSETKLTSDAAANINVIDDSVYYTTEKGSGSAVYCYDVSTGTKTTCFTTSAEIEEMYVSSDLTFYYLSDGDLYTWEDGTSVLTEENGEIVHFIPTDYGCITATGSRWDYTLYADGELISTGVTSFYTADDYLLLEIGSENYQARIRDLFGDAPASAKVTAVAAGKATITLKVGSVSAKAIVYVKPATVTLTSATATSDGGITVKWAAVTGADKYRLYRKTGDGAWETVTTTTSTSYTDTGLTALTTYTYTVRAYVTLDGTTYSSTIDQTGISATTRMEAPTLSSLTAVSTTSQKISWTKVSGAEGYRVYQKVNGSWKQLGNTTKTSYTIKSLTTGTTYTYTVRAYYTENGSTMLGSYDQTGLSAVCCPPDPVLSAAVCDDDGDITVTWEKVSGVTGYRIYRKTSGGSWKKVATVKGASTVSYTDTGLTSDTTYIYTVKAYKTVSGTNVWSSYDKTGVSATSAITLPDTPTLVSAVCDSYGTVTVTWNKVSNATGYRVYRKVNGKWTKVSTRTKTSYTETGLTYGETYTYTVKAYRKVNGTTVWGSCDKSGISCTVEVAAPVISAVNVSTAGQAKVRWKSVSGVSGYRVYYKQEGGKWTAVGNVGSSVTTKTITGLTSGTNYYFAVRSYWKVDGTKYYSSYAKTTKARTIK